MNIEINNIEQHSATVILTNIDTTYDDRTLYFYLNGTLKNEFSIQDGKTTITFSLTLENAGAKYEVYIELYGWVPLLGDQRLDWVEDSFTTKSEEPDPEEPEEPEEQWWDLASVKTYLNIKETKTGSEYLNECEVLRVDMTFSISGNIQFETVDASGVRIYLSDSSTLDEESGKPLYTILESDSTKTGDAEFEYNITAGDNYYLFIHHYYKDQYGTINFKITVPEKTRPSKFSWSSSKNPGEEFNLTDNEWNSLCQNVNSLLAYSDKYDYNFTKAVKEEPFMAKMFNEILEAIKPISSRTEETLDSYKVEPGDIIKAQALNDLVALVNEID